MSNQANRLSDCPAERLAQCRGQVEVVAYHIVDEFEQKKVLLPGAEGIARHRSRGALMRPLTDVGHVNRLQAEVSALQQRLNIADQRACDQQSELTKALSLVRWFYTHANVHQVGTVMMDAAWDFIARQSAPVAKVCSHIWVTADNRGAGAGEICQACSEHRPAAKGDASMIGIVHTPPMEYDEP